MQYQQCILIVIFYCVCISLELPMFHKHFKKNDKNNRISKLKWTELQNSLQKLDPYNGDMIGTILETRSVEHNDSIAKKFVSLFMRAKLKDYDFASYGDRCEIISKEELRDFIASYSNIFGNREEQKRLSEKILAEPIEANQEKIISQKIYLHYFLKLVTLFKNSHDFCDFRRLLVCHVSSQQCKCPEGMVIEEIFKENATCRLLPNEKCNLKKGDIEKKGVLFTKESHMALCVRNAVCDFKKSDSKSGSMKNGTTFLNLTSDAFCECKLGFSGHSCQQVETSGVSMHFSQWTGYRLYPEEIIRDLSNLIKFRNLSLSLEDRRQNARNLYSRIETDPFRVAIVENDILLRSAANLLFGDVCNPKMQIQLDNPPLAKDSEEWTDPEPQAIIKWQISLLQNGIPLCKYLHNLHCGATSKVCECSEGLQFEKGSCQIKVGFPCDTDFNAPFQYDALQGIKRFSAPPSPICIHGATCTRRTMFFSKRCWCINSTVCDGQKFNEDLFSKVKDAIRKKFVLRPGDNCDPNAQFRLLNPKMDKVVGFEERLHHLAQIADSPVQFCRIEKFENCSQESRKCECWTDFVLQNGECRRQNMDTCGPGFSLNNSLYPTTKSPFLLWKMAEVFAIRFNIPKCIEQSYCFNSSLLLSHSRCHCTNSKAGAFCNESISSFAFLLSDPNFVASIEHRSKVTSDIFNKLNSKMIKLEEHMVRQWGEPCDISSGRKLDVIVKFWKNLLLMHNGNGTVSKMEYMSFQKGLSWITVLIFVQQSSSFIGVCDARLGLTCSIHAGKGRCRCVPGTSLNKLAGVCQLIHNETCSVNLWKSLSKTAGLNSSISWILRCHDNMECNTSKSHPNVSRCIYCNETSHNSSCPRPTKIVMNNNHVVNKTGSSNITVSSEKDQIREKEMKSKKADVPFAMEPLTGKNYLESLRFLIKKYHMLIKLELTEPCDDKINREFVGNLTKLLKVFKNVDEGGGDVVPGNVREPYYGLLGLFQLDYLGLCDWGKYEECSPLKKVCVCMYHHHLLNVGGECHLKANEVCDPGGESGGGKNSLTPQRMRLQCQKGTTCTKTDFGPKKCRRIRSDGF